MKLTLYQNKHRLILIASFNQHLNQFKVLKIDKTTCDLVLTCDNTIYNKSEISTLLIMLNDGNIGGLSKIGLFYGIFGFIRFLDGYYIILISKRSVVALINGHYIYQYSFLIQC